MRRFLFCFFFFLSLSVCWDLPKGFCQSNYEKADELRKSGIIEKIKKAADELIGLGEKALADHDTRAAVDYFVKATNVAPYDYRAYYMLVEIFMHQNQYDTALKVIERSGGSFTDSNQILKLADELDQSIYKEPEKKDNPLVSIAVFKDNKRAAVSYNFDDGAKLAYTDILPMFERFGFKATIPINPGVVPEKPIADSSWGSWEEWRDAHNRGFEIANHAFDHIDLTGRSPEDLEKEINRSYDLIQEKIGDAPASFVFPLNKVDGPAFNKAAERHIFIRYHDYLVKIYPMVFVPIFGGPFFSNEAAEHILQMAMRRQLWVIAECHSLKTEKIPTYKPMEKEFLENHLKFLSRNKDKIWVDTTRNIGQYLLQKKDSRIEWKDLGGHGVEFKLYSALKKSVSSLTVVIAPSKMKKIKHVHARMLNANKDLRTVLSKDDQIYLDIMPSDETIVVEWD